MNDRAKVTTEVKTIPKIEPWKVDTEKRLTPEKLCPVQRDDVTRTVRENV